MTRHKKIHDYRTEIKPKRTTKDHPIFPSTHPNTHPLRHWHYLNQILKNADDEDEFRKIVNEHGLYSPFVRTIVHYIDRNKIHVKSAEHLYEQLEKIGDNPLAAEEYNEYERNVLTHFFERIKNRTKKGQLEKTIQSEE